ncbi:MAG: hypothetical protein Phog2KO_42780 [Phototrophicaceae bacterium]
MDELSYQHLYEIPISDLELSDKAYRALKRTGMTSIGDCIDFYIRLPNVMISARPSFIQVIVTEVKQKVKDAEYWHFVEEYSTSNDEK